MLAIVRTAFVVLCITPVFGADSFEFPPLPSELPVTVQPEAPAVRRPRITVPRPQSFTPGIARPGQPFAAVQPYQPRTVGEDILSWDTISKEYTAKAGELSANFSFSLTNVSRSNVVVNWVRPSCGCTAAKIPPTPWTLPPGDSGHMEFTVDLRNKFGVLSKYVTVDTSEGQKLLNLKISIPTTPQMAAGGPDARTRNMQVAMADRQAVFKGECASCHATPTLGKKGEQLYAAACAICHDAPHRATMVPDLRVIAAKNATGKEYWTHWSTHGKPGSLMPAFAKAQGGPLDDEQIKSLSEFLYEKFPKAPSGSAPTTTASLPNTALGAAKN